MREWDHEEWVEGQAGGAPSPHRAKRVPKPADDEYDARMKREAEEKRQREQQDNHYSFGT